VSQPLYIILPKKIKAFHSYCFKIQKRRNERFSRTKTCGTRQSGTAISDHSANAFGDVCNTERRIKVDPSVAMKSRIPKRTRKKEDLSAPQSIWPSRRLKRSFAVQKLLLSSSAASIMGSSFQQPRGKIFSKNLDPRPKPTMLAIVQRIQKDNNGPNRIVGSLQLSNEKL